jgi:hypothetical protein
MHPGSVVVVVLVVVVAVVVVVATQPPVPHASQQLANCPTHARPPAGALHREASRFTLQDVFAFRVRQHVTAPGRPHTERAAHRTTADLHSGRSNPGTRAAATPAAQAT